MTPVFRFWQSTPCDRQWSLDPGRESVRGEQKRLYASWPREQRGLRTGKTRLHPTTVLFVVCIALLLSPLFSVDPGTCVLHSCLHCPVCGRCRIYGGPSFQRPYRGVGHAVLSGGSPCLQWGRMRSKETCPFANPTVI